MRLFRLLAVFALTAGLAVALGDVSAADDGATKAEKLAKLKEKLKNADPATKAKLLEKFKNADPETKAKLKGLFKGQGKGKAKAEPPQAPPPALAPAPKPAAPAPKPPAEQNPAALARLIDSHLDRKLSEAKVPPAPQASDDEFLRRAYLDLTGLIPTLAQAKAFLDDKAPDKRARLVDELLAGPNFGRHLTDGWMAKLVPGGTDNRFIPRDPFGDWLEKQFNTNRPWNEVVTDILTATGTVEENPAVTFVLANRSTDKLTDQTTQNFLGVQLQCAQCHNHPFTEWKQTEYWGMAEFFAKVRPDNPRNPIRGDNSKIGVQEGAGRSKVKDFFPEGAKTVPAKFLGGPEPELNRAAPYRPVLATWLTAADNPYFAKAMANRVWGQLFGRGIVNPVDDLHDGNAPSHPELLDALAKDFAANGFDLKYLYRAVCNTAAYGRTSKPPKGAADPDPALFARMAVKVMTPEQLFDSLAQVTGVQAQIAERMKDNPKRGPVGPRNQFVQFFLAGAEEANPVEYEAGIPQALKLMNGRMAGNPAAVRAYASAGDRPAEVFERVYLAALSRRPTPAEVRRLTGHLNQAANPAAGYSDILWAVLNSSEFTMVR